MSGESPSAREILPRGPPPDARSGPSRTVSPSLVAVIGLAWAALAAWSLTPASVYLDHDELSSLPSLGGLLPLVGIFLLGWTLMVVASMLPPLTRFASAFVRNARRARGGGASGPVLLVGYLAPWIPVGAGFFLLDFGIHHLIAASSFVADRQQFIWPLTLVAIGMYEASPSKAHYVEHCCSSLTFLRRRWRANRREVQSLEVGLAQGLDAIGATWALMLLMFAAGFTGVGWLVVVTLIALAESTAPLRHAVRWATAIAILGAGAAALVATATSGLPSAILGVTSDGSGYWLLGAALVVGVVWGMRSAVWPSRTEVGPLPAG